MVRERGGGWECSGYLQAMQAARFQGRPCESALLHGVRAPPRLLALPRGARLRVAGPPQNHGVGPAAGAEQLKEDLAALGAGGEPADVGEAQVVHAAAVHGHEHVPRLHLAAAAPPRQRRRRRPGPLGSVCI